MFEIIGVKFPKDSKTYYYEAAEYTFSKGDKCIVERDSGYDIGEVVEEVEVSQKKTFGEGLPQILRLPTEADLKKREEYISEEKHFLNICLEKIQKKGLPIKVIDVHYCLDGLRIICYFTSDQRIDFRDLVKELGRIYKVRIDLYRIGVRDEMKMFGGFGCCGRRLCCVHSVHKFNPVSIKMAKEQNLILTSNKISGVCGRLMCCLGYEYDCYVAVRKTLPKEGTLVITREGKGEVVEVNIPKRKLVVRLSDGKEVTINTNEIEMGTNHK